MEADAMEKAPRQLDEEALGRVLLRHQEDRAGLVLRLAWKAGLSREEITALTWEQFDPQAPALRLGGRTVALEGETAALLLRLRGDRETGPVVGLAPESLSRLARQALDEEGLKGLRLRDLRLDYARRPSEQPAPPADRQEREYRLWQILQSEKGSPAGLALRFSSQLGLYAGEITELTWELLDLSAGTLRLKGRELRLGAALTHLLEAERSRRGPGDDAHVLLTPRSRMPFTLERLSVAVRTALRRGGLEGESLRSLRRRPEREERHRALVELARERGRVSRGDAAALLSVTPDAAHALLSELTAGGELVRVGTRYYPAGSVVPPERQGEAVRAYLAQWGSGYCQDIAEVLHLGKRPTARILAAMVRRGELVLLRREKRYALPEDGAAPPDASQ